MPRDCDQRLPLYTTNVSAFNFPFSYILSNQYKVQDIQKALPYTNEPKHDAGLFPRNIKDYIWSVTPKGETWSWTLLCELTNGNYAFYTASCLSDFDDPKSTMSLSVSPRRSDLIMQVLTDAEYSLYEKKTQPLPKPLPYHEDKEQ